MGLFYYGYFLVFIIKDIILRYWFMKGFYVECCFGWDIYGFFIEYEIDKKFGIFGKVVVMEMGLEKYNEECRGIVMRYFEEWRYIIERLGCWIDFDNDYKIMDFIFMEFEWWVFKQLFDKGEVYQGYCVMFYLIVFIIVLSNFEVNQNYQDVIDFVVVVVFFFVDEFEINFFVWIIIFWILLFYIGLVVYLDFEYVKIVDEKMGKNFIIFEKLFLMFYKDFKKVKFKVFVKYKGKDMFGWKYLFLFDYFYEEYKDVVFKFFNVIYVMVESGIGIVYQVLVFGEDDYNVVVEVGIVIEKCFFFDLVDDLGVFISKVFDFVGFYVKKVDKEIIKYLKGIGRFIVEFQYKYLYFMCYCFDIFLIYKVVFFWFICIFKIIFQMFENIEGLYWVFLFVKEKCFVSWIVNVWDWNVFCNRYWGIFIFLWISDDGEECVCIGSIEELKELSGYEGEIVDFYCYKIDYIIIFSKQGKGIFKCVEEVFDCWFEFGSMFYVSKYYFFENKEEFEKSFFGDFIVEGFDQIRGWFYIFFVFGIYFFGIFFFKNCVVNGIVFVEDGKKMFKCLKNYLDFIVVMFKYGFDVFCLYFINLFVVRVEFFCFKEFGVKEVVVKVFFFFWNSYKFFEG